MTILEFKATLKDATHPVGLSGPLSAMWYAGNGDWEMAHAIAQEIETKEAYWVHAYLHRLEGDPGNAAYWYRRAGKKMTTKTFEKEWEEIVGALL